MIMTLIEIDLRLQTHVVKLNFAMANRKNLIKIPVGASNDSSFILNVTC